MPWTPWGPLRGVCQLHLRARWQVARLAMCGVVWQVARLALCGVVWRPCRGLQPGLSLGRG